MIASFKLDITTPQGQEYSGEIVHACVPLEAGSAGILANHAPYVTVAGAGLCTVREKNGVEVAFKVGKGFFSVAHNRAALLTQSFEKITA